MNRWLLGILIVALLAGAVWLAVSWQPAAPNAQDDSGISDTIPSTPSDPAQPPPPAEPLAPPSEEDFGQRLRSFLADADSLPESGRLARADVLRRDALAREAAGKLLPAESAYVQLALLRATVQDPDALHHESRELLERYQAASEQGWEAYRQRTDPRHQAYRQAEAELMERARAENMPPDELRERLQALRESYY